MAAPRTPRQRAAAAAARGSPHLTHTLPPPEAATRRWGVPSPRRERSGQSRQDYISQSAPREGGDTIFLHAVWWLGTTCPGVHRAGGGWGEAWGARRGRAEAGSGGARCSRRFLRLVPGRCPLRERPQDVEERKFGPAAAPSRSVRLLRLPRGGSRPAPAAPTPQGV